MKTKGFTIIESLVAIGIIAAAVIGTMSAVQSGLSSYLFSKDEITAFYLAQEGFEQLRNVRDENVINGRDWLASVAAAGGDPCAFGQSCTVSPVESAIPLRCPSPGSCPVLRQDSATGFFGYNAAWTATPFTREITLSQISADEVKITVTVSWSKGSQARTFKARENLLHWQ